MSQSGDSENNSNGVYGSDGDEGDQPTPGVDERHAGEEGEVDEGIEETEDVNANADFHTHMYGHQQQQPGFAEGGESVESQDLGERSGTDEGSPRGGGDSSVIKKPPLGATSDDDEEGGEGNNSRRAMPFSLASFLSNMTPQNEEENASTSRDDESSEHQEFSYINGTYVRVSKDRVNLRDLDWRLDEMSKQRRHEVGLMRMYGLDDRKQAQQGRGDNNRGGGDGGDRGRRGGDDRRRSPDRSREKRRSRSRSRDRERRRSKSKDRRRSKSRERRRSRSRSKDRSNRRNRDSSPDRSRRRDDRDRFGREKDKFGREKDRFGRDRRERESNRDEEREDHRSREQKSSRSPRSEHRDDSREHQQMMPNEDDRFAKAGWRGGNNCGPHRPRNEGDGGWGRGGNGHYREDDRPRNEMAQDMRGEPGPNRVQYPHFGEQRDGGVGGGAFSEGQDFGFQAQQQIQFQAPPMPVPPPDPFPQRNFQPGLFNQPPPMDSFSSSTGGQQPWMGASMQQGPPPPPPQQSLPLGMTGDYSQPPPPLPAGLNLLNNGDFNTMKTSMGMLSETPDPNSAVGYGMNVVNSSQAPQGMGDNFSAYSKDNSYGNSGTNDDGDPMDLDMPEGTDDFQKRVIEEVKNAIRPYFTNKQISKDDYKEILKKCVPKVSQSGEINPKKINNLVGAYVKKLKSPRSK